MLCVTASLPPLLDPQGEQEMSALSEKTVVIKRMVCLGEGVWVSFKGSSSLELFHTVTKSSLQNIDVKSTLTSIMKSKCDIAIMPTMYLSIRTRTSAC